jgi:hypothetical protein
MLNPEFIASLSRTETRQCRANKLFAAADRLAELGEPITDAEIEAEITVSRQESRSK